MQQIIGYCTNYNNLKKKIQGDITEFSFGEAYDTLYHFIWDDLANWYIEASKAEPNKPLLAYLLEQVLVLAHPFAPFLTETIWQTLAWEADSLLASREATSILTSNTQQAGNFTEIQAIVSEARYITKALNVSGATLYYQDSDFLAKNAATIARLARLQAVTASQTGSGLSLTSTTQDCWLDIDAKIARHYASELDDKAAQAAQDIKQLEARLNNTSYVQNAPEKVVGQTREQLATAQSQLEAIKAEQARFAS